MKRNYLIIIVFFILSLHPNLMGQDTLKASAKKWVTELNINPFNGTLSLNNINGQIKFRRFMSDKIALRLALTISYKQDNSTSKSTYGLNTVNTEDIRHSQLTAFNIGTERHFKGTRRLSPYIGWDIGLGYCTSKEIIDEDTYSETIKGAWAAYQVININGQSFTYTSYTERGFFSIGGNLVTGFDLYVAKGFYMGYELLFGLNYIKYSKIDISIDYYDQGGNLTNNSPDTKDESWRFGPELTNGIRIGYVF
jgi:hypothetical protein